MVLKSPSPFASKLQQVRAAGGQGEPSGLAGGVCVGGWAGELELVAAPRAGGIVLFSASESSSPSLQSLLC